MDLYLYYVMYLWKYIYRNFMGYFSSFVNKDSMYNII